MYHLMPGNGLQSSDKTCAPPHAALLAQVPHRAETEETHAYSLATIGGDYLKKWTMYV